MGSTINIIGNKLSDPIQVNLDYDLIWVNQNNHQINYDGDYLVQDILKSYSINGKLSPDIWIKIFNQILIDFPRMKITCNGNICDKIENLHHCLANLLFYRHPVLHTIYHLIILFCTQATFYHQYSTIHHMYTLSDFDLYIVQTKDIPEIHIINQNDTIILFLCKKFHYLNISNNQILTTFKTMMKIVIKLNPNNKTGSIQYGQVVWTFIGRNILII